MANIDNPRGLTVDKRTIGKDSITPYYVPASYGTALFIGDPVLVTGDGNAAATKGYEIGTLSAINKAGVTGACTGTIVGFMPDFDQPNRLHNLASTERVALVCDDPHAEFLIQAAGTLTAAMVGMNADMIFTHAGNALTGISGVELSTAGTVPAVTATFPLKILGLDTDVNNSDISAANSNVRVKINNHTFGTAVVGIA